MLGSGFYHPRDTCPNKGVLDYNSHQGLETDAYSLIDLSCALHIYLSITPNLICIYPQAEILFGKSIKGEYLFMPEASSTQLIFHSRLPRSFGVVLWELLTGEIPYKDVDSSAIIWGVGSNSLHLPVPTSCPDGFKILLRQCW